MSTNEFSDELKLGNNIYKVSYNLSTLAHLCSYRELTSLNFIKKTKDSRFNECSNVASQDFTDEDWLLLSHLFHKSLKTRFTTSSYSGTMGVITTLPTGNASRWSYVINAKASLTRIFDTIQHKDSMVLYSRPLPDGNTAEPVPSNERIEEVSMLAITSEQFRTYTPSEQVQEILARTPAPTPEVAQILTKEAIQAFIRGEHAA